MTQLLLKAPIRPPTICAEILSPLVSARVDSLHLEYVQRLVEKDIVSLPDVLVALLRTSPARSGAPADSTGTASGTVVGADGPSGDAYREVFEEGIFIVLSSAVREYKPKSHDSVWASIQGLSDWMEALMAASGTGMLDEPGGDDTVMLHGPADEGRNRREALAELIIAIGGNEDVRRILAEGARKEKRLVFQTSLSMFTQCIQVRNPGLSARMEGLFRPQQNQRGGGGSRGTKGTETIDGMMGLGDATDDGPMVWARGGLFVWLNGLVS